jgi:predicted nucleic-acid-binding Zn-ribbon protein/rRNA processing protein Gar1
VSFEGRVSRESHEGGLLVSFEGKAPRLGAKLRIVGGKPLGKVETVLGPADEPLIHLLPLANGIDGSKAIDSPVEIAPRHSRDSSKRRPMNTHRGKKDWSKNSGNSRMKSGDWVCPKCKNHNFANKKVCNRTGCEQPKPKVVGRGRDSRGFRPSKSDGFRDSNMKPGDWNCPKCKNHNFAKREVCNRCDTRKPVEGKGSRKTKGRQRRPNPRDGWKPRRRG